MCVSGRIYNLQLSDQIFSKSSTICSEFSTPLFQYSLIYSHNDSRNQTDPQNNFVPPETFMYVRMYLCLCKISSLCLSLGRLTLFADFHRGIRCQSGHVSCTQHMEGSCVRTSGDNEPIWSQDFTFPFCLVLSYATET